MARYTTPSLIVLAVLASAAFSLTEARDLQQIQGIKGMLSDTDITDTSINKTTVMPTIDPAVNKTMPPFLNKTDIAMMLPAVNKTITADPAMNKTGIFNKTMMEPADPVINRTQLMPTITLPSKAAMKANITAALDPMTAINTTIATAAGFRPSGGGSTGDNAVGFGNVDAGGFNAVPGVECATGLTQCNGGPTCVNLLSDTGYCGSCTTSCDFYTQVCGNGQCICNEAGGFSACAARGGRCLNTGCPDGQTQGAASDINVQGTRGMPNAAASMSVMGG